MNTYVLPILAALLATVLLGGLLLGRLWQQHEEHNVEKKCQERERRRLADRRGPRGRHCAWQRPRAERAGAGRHTRVVRKVV
jgi:hypothetical protein